jgi:predicted flap endonuclease-1-like 5' DNA nuclease
MWPICSASLSSLLWLLGPLLLGLLTAWWIWAGRRTEENYSYVEPAAEPARFTPPPVAPEPVVTPPAAEPVKFTAPPVAPPVAPIAAAPVAAAIAMTAIGIPAAIGSPDDLLQIKGVGPKLNDLLISLGVRRFDQIAKWTGSDVAKVDEHLGAFKGRIDRDLWIEQSGLLARGDIAAFEAKFGKLDSENQ